MSGGIPGSSLTTHRGDQHLTVGLPAILAHYEQAAGKAPRTQIIVDRDQMAAQFLADLVAAGRTVVTVLRTDQYEGLSSFTEVGAFVPLEHDRHGKLIREVATARFALPVLATWDIRSQKTTCFSDGCAK
jgi:hypothetical protein